MKTIWYILVLLLLAGTASAEKISVNGTQYFPDYSGNYIAESSINESISYNTVAAAWDIRTLSGLYRVYPTQTIDAILNPLTGTAVSSYSAWTASYWKTQGQGSKTQHGIISKTVTYDLNTSILTRSMWTTENVWFNVTYQILNHKLKMAAYINGSGKKEWIDYAVDFDNGRVTSLDNNSKRFNLNLSNTVKNILFDYSDISNNHNVSTTITQGNRFNLYVLLENGSIITTGNKSGFDPYIAVNGSTTPAWNGTTSLVNISNQVCSNNLALKDTVSDYYSKWDGNGCAKDQNSVTANNGIVNGGLGYNSSGKYGSAFQTNATQNVSFGKVNYNASQSFTLMGWMYMTSGQIGTYAVPFGQDNSFWMEVRTDRISWSLRNSTSSYQTVCFTGNCATSLNTWYHVAGTRDASTNITKLYVNGVLKTTSSFVGATRSDIGNFITIGSSYFPGGNNYPFLGLVDDVRLYNRSLTNDEINQTMNNSKSYGSAIFQANFTTGNQGSIWNATFSGNMTGNASADNTTYESNGTNRTSDVNNSIPSANKNQTQYIQISASDPIWTMTNMTIYDEASSPTPTPSGAIPPNATNLAQTNSSTGFWINYTWSAGAGNITDSYNVSINNTWTNGSANNYSNGTVAPHGWRNSTVWAYNSSGSGNLSNGSVSMNTQIPNNAPVISNISNSYTITEGQYQIIDADYSDLDGDVGTFDRNFTKGSFNTSTGVLNFTTQGGDNASYNLQINVTDTYGAVSTKNFTINVLLFVPTNVKTVIASDTLRASNDSVVTPISGSYVLLKTLTISENITGTVVIKYDISNPQCFAPDAGWGDIRKNSISLSVEDTWDDCNSHLFSHDISNFNLNTTDTLELWGKVEEASMYDYSNFRLYYDYPVVTQEVQVQFWGWL